MTATGERRASSTDAAILEMVRRRTETTRVEIARELGVTPATVTYAVKRLMAAGLLVETGLARSNGGKRASLLRLNNRARRAIGCTIEADRLSMVGVDMTGALRSRVVLPLAPDASPAAVSAVLRDALETMEPDRDPHSTTGIGFATPVRADGRGEELLAAVTGDLAFPTTSADASTCAALGSFWSGEQPEHGMTATVHMDDRLGLTILRDGQPLQSAPGATLEHVCVDPHGPPCSCGAAGCLTRYASPGAIRDAAAEDDGLAGPALTSDVVRIALAATRGDPRALSVLDDAFTALARATWTITSAVGIRAVVFSGAGIQAAPGLLHATAGRYLAERSHATGIPLDVAVSQVQPHPGAVGAAVLALQTFMEPGGQQR
ncbi:ROK family protein [Brachybacterium sp. GCM10030267]|uniref:ROK family transcriptional regulator n=1 Tax=Brachybacterium sp. GCM10030267 TaxID=3273381 RepID=UPI003607AA45